MLGQVGSWGYLRSVFYAHAFLLWWEGSGCPWSLQCLWERLSLAIVPLQHTRDEYWIAGCRVLLEIGWSEGIIKALAIRNEPSKCG
jgi:hypothetical protein